MIAGWGAGCDGAQPHSAYSGRQRRSSSQVSTVSCDTIQCLLELLSFNFLTASQFSSYWTLHHLSCRQIWRGVTGVDTWVLDVVLGRRNHTCGRWVWTRSRTVCRWSCFMASALGWGYGASTWMPSLQTDQFMPWISLVSSWTPSFAVHLLCQLAVSPHFLFTIQIINVQVICYYRTIIHNDEYVWQGLGAVLVQDSPRIHSRLRESSSHPLRCGGRTWAWRNSSSWGTPLGDSLLHHMPSSILTGEVCTQT